jgi:hypothetical protein
LVLKAMKKFGLVRKRLNGGAFLWCSGKTGKNDAILKEISEKAGL